MSGANSGKAARRKAHLKRLRHSAERADQAMLKVARKAAAARKPRDVG